MFGETICPQCKKPFRKGQHNARFCTPQCKDGFHNAEKMAAYHLRKLAEVEEAEDQRVAKLDGAENRKPLAELLQALPKPEPFKRRAF